MQRPTQFSPPQSPSPRAGEQPGTASRKKPIRTFIIVAQILAALLFSALGARAQHVSNGSFEILSAGVNVPGWSFTGLPIALPGVTGWYSYGGSPDVFYPPYVPCNYMTSSICRTPYHGNNYAGISTGIPRGGTFSTEVLVGTITPSTGAGTYLVSGRLAMGSARNNPCRIQFSLFSSSGSPAGAIVGSFLVNNTNWNLFSQTITVPAGYDRIRIEGIPDLLLANTQLAYCFIDSVDVTPVSNDPCAFLSAYTQYAPNDNGSGCCWNLYIDDLLPSWMTQVFYVRLTSVAPSSLSGPVTNGPGLSSVTTLPYTAIWNRTAGGFFPTGTWQYVGTYCLSAGPPPQMQIIEFLGPNYQVLCRDTLWTQCRQEWTPCMNLAIQNILCGPRNSAGNRTYTFNMSMNVLNPFPGYVVFYSPQGSVTPGVVSVPPYTQVIPMTFTDLPPTDGHICIYADHHVKFNNRDSIICRDTVCVDLPQCPEDCCRNFQKAISQLSIRVTNGSMVLSGCASAGPNQIKRFSATIVGAQLRTKCGTAPAGPWTRIFSDIVGGALSSSFGPITLTPSLYFSHEASWGSMAWPACVSFNPCIPFNLNMIFPDPPSGSGCIDTLKFAIRYSFTDCNCVTCDTVITYTVPRRYTRIPWINPITPVNPVIPWDGPGTLSSSTYVQPNPGLLNITMSSETQGTLSVSLPQQESQDDPVIRIVGMSIRPEGVPLTSFAEHGTQNGASISNNMADVSYTLDAGQAKLFDLSYVNDDHDQHIRNIVVFRYLMVGDTTHPDTLTSDTVALYATPPGGGGDVVEPTQSNLQNVRTYALHLVASNDIEEAVNALKLHVNGGATLIAVGPVGDGTDARLKAGADQDGNLVVQVDKDTWTVENLEAGGELAPIYLTFANVGNNAVSVDYSTMSQDGSAISSGTADISSPMRVAGVENEQTSNGVALMPIYPNPTAHSATAQFSLQSAGKVSVMVRDIRGDVVLRLIDGQQFGAGEHLVPFDTQALPAGTYVVTMDVDGHVFTRPLTIVR
jgi:hypothetical protein